MSKRRKQRDDQPIAKPSAEPTAKPATEPVAKPTAKPSKRPPRRKPRPATGPVGLPWPVVIAAACGLLAAWVAAGSTGLMVTPLRHALAGVLLGVTIVALRPGWRRLIVVAVVATLGVVVSLLSGGLPVVDSLAVAAVLASLVFGSSGRARRALLVVAAAAGALAVFRAAVYGAATAWSIDQVIGSVLGALGRGLSGRPLDVGSSLGGVDLLLVMVVFYVGWLRATPSPRLARGLYAAGAILAVQVVYLIALAHATELAAALPEPPMPASLEPGDYRPVDWSLLAGFRAWLPWNLPFVAALAQAGVAMAMLRWVRVTAPVVPEATPPAEEPTQSSKGLSPQSDDDGSNGSPKADDEMPRRHVKLLFPAGAVMVALLAGWLTVWSSPDCDLSGKKIVAYDGGFDRWIAPVHEVLDPGHSYSYYGLLPSLVANLGGEWAVSRELSEEDLAEADVLVVLHPMDRWPEERVERVEQYVRDGGSLLVVAAPMIEQEIDREAAGDGEHEQPLRPVNALLRSTSMSIRDDTAVSPSALWQGAVAGTTHPAVFGVAPRTLGLGLRHSPTIDVSWPARAMIVGRWGWSEPGGDSFLHGQTEPDPGERWGDLVLAAESPLGEGTVVAYDGYWSATNLGLADGYETVGRLLGYLAHRPSGPQSMWRQILGLAAYVVLFVLIVRRPAPARLLSIALVLAFVFTGATLHAEAGRPIPSVDSQSPAGARPIAYVDASHLELGNDESWANDGADGLLLTLARNGYLPLRLDRWDPERLDEAKLLIVMGPGRPFSARELEQIDEFVDGGGLAICMVGATEADAARSLLDNYDFELPCSPSTDVDTPEAEPVGWFPEHFGRMSTTELRKSNKDLRGYLDDVFFFRGWPIHCRSSEAKILVQGDEGAALVISRSIGKGSIVLIGDSHFALNQNHGYYNGQPYRSCQENATFWRWLLSYLRGDVQMGTPDGRRPPTNPAAFRVSREVWR